MKALVTGGAGFIGSHLCEKLLREGYEVNVIDDLSTGSEENLSNCLTHPGFRFVQESVLNESAVRELVPGCDIIYHLAAAVGVKLIVQEPVRTIQTNVKGTEMVLDLASKYGVKVVLASTSEVYGKNGKTPFREDDDRVLGSTTYSRWSYACSKAVDEFLGFAYHRQFGLPVLIVRLFNTVGERQTGQYGMVIPRFIQAALRDEPIKVYGDGKQSRCFAYVQDVIEGVTALAADPSAYGDVYNVGSQEETSIEGLAMAVKQLTASRSEIRYVPYEDVYGKNFDDMRRRIPSLEKIHKQVGYQPKTSLTEILSKIIRYSRRQMSVPTIAATRRAHFARPRAVSTGTTG